MHSGVSSSVLWFWLSMHPLTMFVTIPSNASHSNINSYLIWNEYWRGVDFNNRYIIKNKNCNNNLNILIERLLDANVFCNQNFWVNLSLLNLTILIGIFQDSYYLLWPTLQRIESCRGNIFNSFHCDFCGTYQNPLSRFFAWRFVEIYFYLRKLISSFSLDVSW